MSLNKERILNELGNVMNQLQSADCGCMGKLFSNSNQGGQPVTGTPQQTYGGCRRGCCHSHGCHSGTPCAGEPYSMDQQNNHNNMHGHGMGIGNCNPPKLYADTYSYLNNNLMQPVIQEVYNDLKTISPTNTIMNNPLGAQLGLAGTNMGNAGNSNAAMTHSNNIPGGNMPNMAAMGGAVNMNSTEQSLPQNNSMGGMGPQIVKMIMGDSKQQRNVEHMPGQANQMVSGTPQAQTGTPSGNTRTNLNPNQLNTNLNSQPAYQGDQHSYNVNNMGSIAPNSTMQYMTQPSTHVQNSAGDIQGNNMQNNVLSRNMQMGSANAMKLNQQMEATNPAYGQHNPGMAKFNEMFPGVMQGGDLGFDPMAIAIQMNPANQQKAAMNTMQKFLYDTPLNRVMDGKNANPPQNISNAQQYAHSTNQQTADQRSVQANQVINQQIVPGQQQSVNNIPQQQQMVFNTAKEGAAVVNENDPGVYYQTKQQQQQIQCMADPSSGAATIPPAPVSNVNGNLEGQMRNTPASLANYSPPKEPIFPADNSKILPTYTMKPQRHGYEFNTLGQPIQMLPAHQYHPQDPGLPQTLSPQPMSAKLPNDATKYSNVKSTVSKTSLMGNKLAGRTSSRSQLQHIYNQYKGSQSFTQQNVQSPVQGATFSEGKLNVSQANASPLRAPVEKYGGDVVENQTNDALSSKVERVMGQVGDVPTPNKTHGDELGKPIPSRKATCRNGLQDVVYTAYPSSAAWSFHGRQQHRPVSGGYHFRQ